MQYSVRSLKGTRAAIVNQFHSASLYDHVIHTATYLQSPLTGK